MEIRSLSALTQQAEQAEQIAKELRDLNLAVSADARLPEVPVPLTLESAIEWLKAADESRRQPRRSRSKRLLEAQGIETAPIPAAVLDEADAISELLEQLTSFPEEIRPLAILALGRALTKDLADAEAVAEQFLAAAEVVTELKDEVGDHLWVFSLAVAAITQQPQQATEIADQARDVLQQCSAAVEYGVSIEPFETFDGALRALSEFNRAMAENTQRAEEEGLTAQRPSFEGSDVAAATAILQQSRVRLEDEKRRLSNQVQDLTSKLEAIGGSFSTEGTTLAELRDTLPNLQAALDKRRSELRRTLGKEVFRVVESLASGELPSSARVTDAALGQTLRKAVECGYRVRIEVPREDQ